MAGSSGSLHENEQSLKSGTIDRHRAIVSIMEELEAIDWYDQRVDAATDEELKGRVEMIQGRTQHGVDVALAAIVELIDDLKAAKDKGVTDEQLAEAWGHQRKASFYIDFVGSENSTGFHAGQESLRVLADAMDSVRKGQLAVRKLDLVKEPGPDKTNGDTGK